MIDLKNTSLGISKKNQNFFIIIFLICFSIYEGIIGFCNFDGDLLWHYKLGESMLHNGITDIDLFSWQEGLTWISQEWLLDIFIYSVIKVFGNIGFALINIGIVFLFVFVIYNENKKKNIEHPFIFITVILIYICFYFHHSNRPSLYSNVIFAILFFKLLNVKKFNIKDIITFFILGILLSNVHGGCLFASIIIFCIFLFLHLLVFIKDKNNNVMLGIVSNIFAFFIGTFINPYGIKIYTVGIKSFGANTNSYISEWKNVFSFGTSYYAYIIICLIAIIAIATSKDFRNLERKAIVCLGASCAFFISGLIMVRAQNLAYIACIGLGYKYIELFVVNVIKKITKGSKSFDFVKTSLLRYNIFLLIAICCAIVGACVNDIPKTNNFEEYIDDVYSDSTEMMTYIKENLPKNARIFNEYNSGDYMIFKDIKVFIDPRQHPYCNELGNGSLEDNFYVIYGSDFYYRLEKICNEYNIEYVYLISDLSGMKDADGNYRFNDNWDLLLETKNKNGISQLLYKIN